MFICIFLSCKNNSKEMECFSHTSGKDSIYLSLTNTDGVIMGVLVYKLYEKDQNYGTIKGILAGDTLFANYTFMSEGLESIREVVFLKKGNGYIEGYGEMEDKKGEMVFNNKGSLQFNSLKIFSKTECPN